MDYQEILHWMFEQLPMYQREGQAAYKADLDNTLALDRHLNHPHRQYKTIHVAGTNGKGSVSHMLASVLQEAGYRTGLYTSPHLKDFRERIKIDGEMISEDFITSFVTKNKLLFEKISPSFFEMTVAMAFQYFAEEAVDIAVIEVGLGGRLDSTNIITPLVSVITNISFDHCALLGNSLQEIAGEKAGIIKPDIPVVIGTNDPAYSDVFIRKALEAEAPLTFADEEWSITRTEEGNYNLAGRNGIYLDNLYSELKGHYQMKNIPVVVETSCVLQNLGLNIHEKDIRNGIGRVIENTGLNGRWQCLATAPLTVCDTGHNEDGIKEILKQIAGCRYDHLHMVIGMVNDKEADTILRMLPKEATYYFTKASIPRAMDEKLLAIKATEAGLRGRSFPTVSEAYACARQTAGARDMIFIGGSTFVVAEVI